MKTANSVLLDILKDFQDIAMKSSSDKQAIVGYIQKALDERDEALKKSLNKYVGFFEEVCDKNILDIQHDNYADYKESIKQLRLMGVTVYNRFDIIKHFEY